ncbi:MAG TPA: hypothetical protein VIU39_13470 [Anaerolineales bacterium]
MIGYEVIATLLLTRVALPVFLILLIGEWVRRTEKPTWFRA